MNSRFTARDLFWLVAVVVLLFVWRMDHSRESALIADNQQRIEQLDSKVSDYVEYSEDLRSELVLERKKSPTNHID
jgi:hypothetical protein